MQKVLVNCDWLQYSVLTAEENPELFCPEGFRVEVMSGNNIFQHRAMVMDERGRKWLTLLWKPYSSLLNARLMTVQVGNFVLYGGGIMTAWRLVQQVVDCAFNSMGRVDVCADFEISDEQLQAIKHLNSGHYYVQGKQEGSVWWHQVKKHVGDKEIRRKQFHCLAWGSKTSKISVKLYHKSREQGLIGGGEDAEKPYIVEQWKLAQLDIRKVWRLEFSMSESGQLSWMGKAIMLEDVASPDWLARVFSTLLSSRFKVRINEGRRQGHKNLDPIVEFLRFDAEHGSLRWILGHGDDIEFGEDVKVLRMLMSKLQSPVVASSWSVSAAMCDAVLEVIKSARLEGYFRNHFGKSSREYLDDVMQQAGSQIVEVDANPRRIFE